MISPSSEVLTRHFSLFAGKSVLLAGAINDDFPAQLSAHCKSLQVWSFYFDYARQHANVTFAEQFQGNADLIVYYWSKNKAEVNFQLQQLLAQAPIGQEVFVIGENRGGIRSAEKQLADYGDIGKIDSARRCSLYHFTLQQRPNFDESRFWQRYQLPTLTVCSLPGVFSAAALDDGTALLLQTLDHLPQGDILDVGCGAGVIGATIKQKKPQANLWMSDIHALALASTRKTLAENGLQAEVLASDVFSEISAKFDLIISNPPFHDGLDTAYRAVNELIAQAKWHLRPGGELRLVANRHLAYADLLSQHFGHFEVLAQNNQFKVYSVTH